MSVDEHLAAILAEQKQREAEAAAADAAADVVEQADEAVSITERVAGITPARFKPEAEWSVADQLEHRASGRKPETDEYRAYRRQVLEDHGLADDDPTPGAMSVADHLAAIRRG